MAAGRRQARRQALFVLYQWDVTGQPLASLFEGEVDPLGAVARGGGGRGGRRARPPHHGGRGGLDGDRLGAVERNTLRIAVHELDAGDVRRRWRSTRRSRWPGATRPTRQASW